MSEKASPIWQVSDDANNNLHVESDSDSQFPFVQDCLVHLANLDCSRGLYNE